MIWNWLLNTFIIFSILWLIGIISLFFREKSQFFNIIASVSPALANIAIMLFIFFLWKEIDRPPLKTMAETRIWYSMFVSLICWIIYLRTKAKAIYILGFVMSSVFIVVDIIHPEYQSNNLMPALQSPWFIPHVVIYMISYAVLAAACLTALIGIISKNKSKLDKSIDLSMKLIYPGFALLSLGMIMGAVWAKIAWGNYWTWDPKETWALLTWLFYLLTIHIQYSYPKKRKLLVFLLAFSFIVLIITWLGIRYFPNGMSSVHVYG